MKNSIKNTVNEVYNTNSATFKKNVHNFNGALNSFVNNNDNIKSSVDYVSSIHSNKIPVIPIIIFGFLLLVIGCIIAFRDTIQSYWNDRFHAKVNQLEKEIEKQKELGDEMEKQKDKLGKDMKQQNESLEKQNEDIIKQNKNIASEIQKQKEMQKEIQVQEQKPESRSIASVLASWLGIDQKEKENKARLQRDYERLQAEQQRLQHEEQNLHLYGKKALNKSKKTSAEQELLMKKQQQLQRREQQIQTREKELLQEEKLKYEKLKQNIMHSNEANHNMLKQKYASSSVLNEDGYCYIGTDDMVRHCVDAYAGDICTSGDIYNRIDECLKPTSVPSTTISSVPSSTLNA